MPTDHQQQSRPSQQISEQTAVSQKKPVQAASPPVSMHQHLMQLQRTAGNRAVMQWMTSRRQTVQRQTQEQEHNQTGLPDGVKAGMEQLSGVSLSDVRVHYNSGKPAQMQALAYAQGTDIHVAPGQEQHVAHEAWHVVQQKQGRVKPTLEVRGNAVNDDPALEREADTMGARALQTKAAPVQRMAATGGPASDSSRAPMQLRGANPYAFGGGTTSHHIIPHSVLMHNLNLLDAGQRVSVMGNFLPQFDRLTLETVIKASIQNKDGDALAVTYDGQTGTLGNVESDTPAGFQQAARTPFGNLSGVQQGLIRFDGQDFAAFRQQYLQLKGGQVQNPTEKEMCLLEVFYEWQSGNQFYGPDRYEPGDKDGFDADATHVLGDADYVGELRGIYDQLKPNQQGKVKSLNQQQKAEMVLTLNSLANLGSQDRDIPANSSTDWVRLDSDVKEQALATIEGYNRVQASGIQGARKDHYRVHKGIIRAHLAKLQGKAESKLDAGLWRQMIHFLNGKQGVADPSPLDYPTAGTNFKVRVSGNQFVISIAGFEGKEGLAKSNGKQYSFKDLYEPLDQLNAKYAAYLRTLFEL